MTDIFNELEKILDKHYPYQKPKLDGKETPETFKFTINTPGIPPDKIQVSNTGTTLFIKTPLEEITIPIPQGSDTTCINASLKYGVLTIVIYKKHLDATPKLIPVIEE